MSLILSGSLSISGSVIAETIVISSTASFSGTASWAENVVNGGGSAFPYTGSAVISGSLDVTGSLKVTGSITVNGKVANVLSVTGSSLYSSPSTKNVGTDNSIFIGLSAGEDTNNVIAGNRGNKSVFIGNYAAYQSLYTRYSVFLGYYAGYQVTQTDYSAFIGYYSGYLADDADNSVFVGSYSGQNATSGKDSVFLGYNAGADATNSDKAVFVGKSSGRYASTSSYSTFLGYRAGFTQDQGVGTGRNNIIIGSNLGLEYQRQDSINIGGLIFGTGSYYNASDIISSGSANGKIGVNQPLPQYSLDVSGSIGLTDLFVLASKDVLPTSNVPSGSIMTSGSNADFKPYFWNGDTWTSLI